MINHINRWFRLPLESKVRRDVVAVFRILLTDKRSVVRRDAFEALLSANDPVAVQLVSEGFKDPKKAQIPAGDAVKLLYRGDPRQHIALIRPLLASKDPKAQIEAVRALAFDPQSRAKIVELLGDARSSVPLRIGALESLATGGAGELPANALRIVKNKQLDAKLRGGAIRWMMVYLKGGAEQVTAVQQVEFARAVESIFTQEPNAPKELKKFATECHSSLKKEKAVLQYYKNRKGKAPKGAALQKTNASVLADKSKPLDARCRALEGLPLETIYRVIGDPGEHATLRKMAIRSVVKKLKANKVKSENQVKFAKLIDKLTKDDAPKELRTYTQRISPWLRKQFSAVRKADEESK